MVPCCVCSKPVDALDNLGVNYACPSCSAEIYKLEYAADSYIPSGYTKKSELWNKHIETVKQRHTKCWTCKCPVDMSNDNEPRDIKDLIACGSCADLFRTAMGTPVKTDDKPTSYMPNSNWGRNKEKVLSVLLAKENRADQSTKVLDLCSTCGGSCSAQGGDYRSCSSCEEIFTKVLDIQNLSPQGRLYWTKSSYFNSMENVKAIVEQNRLITVKLVDQKKIETTQCCVCSNDCKNWGEQFNNACETCAKEIYLLADKMTVTWVQKGEGFGKGAPKWDKAIKDAKSHLKEKTAVKPLQQIYVNDYYFSPDKGAPMGGHCQLITIPDHCPECDHKIEIRNVGYSEGSGSLVESCEHTDIWEKLIVMRTDKTEPPLPKEEGTFYNVWFLTKNRWTNSQDQDPDRPRKMTLAEANQILDISLGKSSEFEVRTLDGKPVNAVPSKSESNDKDKAAKFGVWHITEERWFFHIKGEKLSSGYTLSLKDAQESRTKLNKSYMQGAVFQVRSLDGTVHPDEAKIEYNIWNQDSNRWTAGSIPEHLSFVEAQDILKNLNGDGIRYLIKVLDVDSASAIKKDPRYGVFDLRADKWVISTQGLEVNQLSIDGALSLRSKMNAEQNGGFEVRCTDGLFDESIEIKYNVWRTDQKRWTNFNGQDTKNPIEMTFADAKKMLGTMSSSLGYEIRMIASPKIAEIEKIEEAIMTEKTLEQDIWVNDFYLNGGIQSPNYTKISVPCSCTSCNVPLEVISPGDKTRSGYVRGTGCKHVNDYIDIVAMRTDKKKEEPKKIESQDFWIDVGFINPLPNTTKRYTGKCQKISIPINCPCCSKKIVPGTGGKETQASGITTGCEHTNRYSDILAMRTGLPKIKAFFPQLKEGDLRAGMRIRCREGINEGFVGQVKTVLNGKFTIDWDNKSKSSDYYAYDTPILALIESFEEKAPAIIEKKPEPIKFKKGDRVRCLQKGTPHYLHRGTVSDVASDSSQIVITFDDKMNETFKDSEHLYFVLALTKETVKIGMRVRCIYQDYTTTGKTGAITKVDRGGQPTIEWDDGYNNSLTWSGSHHFEERGPDNLSWDTITSGLKVRLDLPNHSRHGKTAVIKRIVPKEKGGIFSVLFDGETLENSGWPLPKIFTTVIDEPQTDFNDKTLPGTKLLCTMKGLACTGKIATLVSYSPTNGITVKWDDVKFDTLWSSFSSFEIVKGKPNFNLVPGIKLVCNTKFFKDKTANLVKIDDQGYLHIKWDDGTDHSTMWVNNGYFDIFDIATWKPEAKKETTDVEAAKNILIDAAKKLLLEEKDKVDVEKLLDVYLKEIKKTVSEVLKKEEAPKPKEVRPANRDEFADAVISLLHKHAYPFGGYLRDKISGKRFGDLDLFIPRYDSSYEHLTDLDIVNVLTKAGFTVQSDLKPRPIYAFNRVDKLSNTTWLVENDGHSFLLDLVRSSASSIEKDNPFALLDADVNSLYQDKDGNILAAPSFNKQEVIKNIKAKKFVSVPNAAPERLNKLIKKGYAQIKEAIPLIEPKTTMTIEAKKKDYQAGDQFDIEISWEAGDKTTLRRATCIDPKFKMEGSDESTMLVMLDKAFASTEACSQEIFSQYVDTATSLGIDYSGKTMWFIDERTKIIPSNKKVKDTAKMVDPDDLEEGDVVELEIMDNEGSEPIKVKATVLNIDYDDNGDVMCFLESLYESDEGDVSSFVLSDKFNKDRAKKYGFKPGAKRAWLIDDNTNILKRIASQYKSEPAEIKKDQVKTMSEDKSFMEQFKSEGEEALYRVTGTQMTKGVQAALLTIFRDKGGMDESKLSVVKEMLETEIGRSMISLMLGHALPYAPVIKDDPRVQRLASEFRIGGMAVVGNEVVSLATAYLLPAVSDALRSLPALGETAKETLAPAMKSGKKKLKKVEPETPVLEEVMEATVSASAAATH